MHFPIITAVAVSHQCWYVVFNFHSVQNIFEFPFWPLNKGLIKCVQFNFQIFRNVQESVTHFHFNPTKIRKYILYDFNCFKFIEICFMTEYGQFLVNASVYLARIISFLSISPSWKYCCLGLLIILLSIYF